MSARPAPCVQDKLEKMFRSVMTSVSFRASAICVVVIRVVHQKVSDACVDVRMRAGRCFGDCAIKGGWGFTYELGHEGNHEVEKTDGLDESETQNGVREQLSLEGGVAGNTVQQGGEDKTDTDTSTGQTDGSGTHTQVLGDLDKGVGHLGVVGAGLLLEGRACGGVEDGRALHGLHGAGLGHACKEKKFLSTERGRGAGQGSDGRRAQSHQWEGQWGHLGPQWVGPMTFEVDGLCDDKLEMGEVPLPVMVRLETLATWLRIAGRATWAMEAMREARTREAIAVMEGR